MPSDKPEPEKSNVKTVILQGRSMMAASFASARHPLHIIKIHIHLINTHKPDIKTLRTQPWHKPPTI